MTEFRNKLSFALSIPAGIMLLIKGISGPTETYTWLLNYLNALITDDLIRSIVTTTLLVLIVISSLGGLSVLAGGFFILKNHVLTGKMLIALGAGVGIIWVLFLLFTLLTTGDMTSALSQYSLIGWIGLILAFMARMIAK